MITTIGDTLYNAGLWRFLPCLARRLICYRILPINNHGIVIAGYQVIGVFYAKSSITSADTKIYQICPKVGVSCMRIVVSDDEPLRVSVWSEWHPNQVIRVVGAGKPQVIYFIVAVKQLDIILLDIRMPDGWNALCPRAWTTGASTSDYICHQAGPLKDSLNGGNESRK